MTYPGNSAISPEVQQRIRTTFEQTLGLAERGSRQEAALGCDFILQLDPQFRPAQTLQDRLKSSDGSVEVDDLRAELAGRPDRAEREAQAAELFGGGGLAADPDLDGLPPILDDLPDLDDLPELAGSAAGAPAATAAEATGSDLASRLRELVEARRFEEALALAAANREAITADAELARLATAAGERNEAAPYVERFLHAAERARHRGEEAEVQALLDKARALDPSHPALAAAQAAAEEDAAVPDAAAPEAVAPDAAAPPDAAPPADAGDLDAFGDFEFGSGDAEGDRRIAELLEEGQGFFDRGDHQSAIDAWSRIFLIDIDHQEASRRIEEARRLKNEQERKIEQVFHEAVDAAEAGEKDLARAGLERVLTLMPGHAGALEQLDLLDSGRSPSPSSRPAPPPPPAAAPPEAAHEPLREEILVPPEPGEAPPASADEAATRTMVASRQPPRRFMLIGSVVLLVVLAASWLVYDNRDSVFPNADEAPPPAAAEIDPIARATRLHDAGKSAMAVNQLRRLPPGSAQYEEAQALISQWEAADQPASPAEPAAADDDSAQRQATLVDDAGEAAGSGHYLRARELLAQAATLGPLPAASDPLQAEVAAQVAPLGPQLELMEMGEYSRALPDLWRMHESRPDDADVSRLIADSYYNLAVRSLQQGDAAAAVEHLEEAVSVTPDDAELVRHLQFAQTYAQRDKDLLYRIYVKYLPPR